MLVARHDIPLGRILTHADFESVAMRNAPEDAVTSLDDIGMRALALPLFAGEPLIERKLAPQGREGMAALIPPKMLAAEVPAPDALEVRPGDRVLISSTLDPEKIKVEGSPYRIVAEAAPVVGESRTGGKRKLVVALTGAEQSYLAAALAYGSIDLALRSPNV